MSRIHYKFFIFENKKYKLKLFNKDTIIKDGKFVIINIYEEFFLVEDENFTFDNEDKSLVSFKHSAGNSNYNIREFPTKYCYEIIEVTEITETNKELEKHEEIKTS
jgi:hypothetical protein